MPYQNQFTLVSEFFFTKRTFEIFPFRKKHISVFFQIDHNDSQLAHDFQVQYFEECGNVTLLLHNVPSPDSKHIKRLQISMTNTKSHFSHMSR